MDPWDATRCRAAKKLYGRPLRVALAGWIDERGYEAFFLREAQRAMESVLGPVDSGVSQEVTVMCEMGMLARVPDGRRVYFVPDLSSSHWAAFAAINEALRSAVDQQRPGRLSTP